MGVAWHIFHEEEIVLGLSLEGYGYVKALLSSF